MADKEENIKDTKNQDDANEAGKSDEAKTDDVVNKKAAKLAAKEAKKAEKEKKKQEAKEKKELQKKEKQSKKSKKGDATDSVDEENTDSVSGKKAAEDTEDKDSDKKSNTDKNTKQPKKKKEKQKFSLGTKSVNRTLKIANFIFVLLLAFQIYNFFTLNSDNAKDAFKAGQMIKINPKTNEVEIAEYVIPTEEVKEENIEQPADEDTTEAEQIKEDEENPELVEEEKKDEQAEDNQDTNTDEDTETEITENTEEAPEEPVEVTYEKDYESARLSIIVTELGLKGESLKLAKTLPPEVSFAFSPYAYELQNKIDEATAEGRQVLLNVMFEPSAYPMEDAGTLTIQSHFESTQNIFRLQSTASKAKGYQGFLTNTDEVATHNLESISPVLNSIKKMDKFFAFYKLPVNSSLEREAKPMALDIVSVEFLLDDEVTEKAILQKLAAAEDDILLNNKKVVVAIRPYKISINTVKKWLKKNLNAGFQIAPISHFVTDN